MRHVLALLLTCLSAVPAAAQLALPGATAPAPVGSVVAPEARPAKRKATVPHAAATAPPAEAPLAGKTLFLNGGKSQMAFSAHDKTVDLARLMLSGTKLSNGQDECQVDVAGMPLALTPLPKTDGLVRFALPIPACPMTLEVLNGAVLVTGDTARCTFTEADCEAAASGLWGTPPGDIGPDQVKLIERERAQAEASVRATYKVLSGATKDRATIKGFAGEQAGFSSHREEICRDYIGESRHGFCGARLTQARAVTLQSELVVAAAAKDARKAAKAARKKKHVDAKAN